MRYVVVSRLPFEFEPKISDKDIVKNNLFIHNVGNLFFTNAVINTLQKQGNEIVRYKQGIDINSFDRGIFIHANIIRTGCESVIDYDNKIIDSSEIPFVMMSIGTDSDKKFRMKISDEMKFSIGKLFNTILERTPEIGVRGEYTKRFITEQCNLPKDKIRVIGCPSVRYFGKQFKKYPRKYPEFSDNLKIAVNYTGYHYDLDEAIFLYNILKRHKNSYVIFTDQCEAELLWYNKALPEKRQHEVLPTTPDHFILREGRARFCANQKGIMKMLSTFDFSVGSRIHQAIVAILSGCPALLIAHSTRVLEIAQYHKIPYILRSELIAKNPTLKELYNKTISDMNEFYKQYDLGLNDYIEYLNNANLDVNSNFILP